MNSQMSGAVGGGGHDLKASTQAQKAATLLKPISSNSAWNHYETK